MPAVSRRARLAALTPLALLAACATPAPTPAPPPAASTAPRPVATPLPAPAPALAWDREPATPGTWRHRLAGRDSVAEFAGTDGRLLFRLTCSADKHVELAAAGRAAGARAMTVRTRTLERAFAAGAMENSVVGRLDPGDPLLAAMAYARGRFAVEVPGLPALYLPAWPEVTRVIDDCQQGG